MYYNPLKIKSTRLNSVIRSKKIYVQKTQMELKEMVMDMQMKLYFYYLKVKHCFYSLLCISTCISIFCVT